MWVKVGGELCNMEWVNRVCVMQKGDGEKWTLLFTYDTVGGGDTACIGEYDTEAEAEKALTFIDNALDVK